MGHFTAKVSRSRATPPEWLKVGANLNELVNDWAERGDIVTYVGEGAGETAPACFKPTIAEMEVNTEICFEGIKPKWIGDLTDRRRQFDHPVAMGAVLHEAMHARHSLWDFEPLLKHKNRMVAKIAELFEETRIEARGVKHYPRNRSFLRACAMKLILGDMKEHEEGVTDNGLFALSQHMLLVSARVDAGVLEDEDADFVTRRAKDFLGEELYEKLRDIWRRAQAYEGDTEFKPLLKLAEEWVETMKDGGHDMQEEMDAANEAAAAMAAALGEMLGEIAGEMGAAAEETEVEAREEGAVVEATEIAEERAAEAARESSEEREHRDAASKIFSKSTGPSSTRHTSSRLIEKRPPTGKERAAAVKVAQLLDKARYRDRVEVTAADQVPPGRLRGRAAMQAEAERSRGMIQTAEPWKRKHRKHREDPELKVGVMVDISGSMSGAMEPMGVTAWMLSEAVRRVQGRAAMVYYGAGVFPVLKPGQHLPEVNIYSAPDPTERFSEAFKAIDGSMNLLHGSGARLLVIVSDICYMRGSEAHHVKTWVERCTRAGVGVMVMTYDDGRWAQANLGKTQARIITGDVRPAEAAVLIGSTAAQALEAAGGRG